MDPFGGHAAAGEAGPVIALQPEIDASTAGSAKRPQHRAVDVVNLTGPRRSPARSPSPTDSKPTWTRRLA